MKALKQIAKEIGVTLHFEKDPTLTNMVRIPCMSQKEITRRNNKKH